MNEQIAHIGLWYLFIEVKKSANRDIFTDPLRASPPDHGFTVDAWDQEEGTKPRVSGQSAHSAYGPKWSISHLRVLVDDLRRYRSGALGEGRLL
jgi:hypothetical protein